MNAEDVAYWFFRLNGCLTIRNFLVHPDIPGPQRTDADLIAMRFPYRQELDMTDFRTFEGQDKPRLLLVEVKQSGWCRLNGPWTERGRGNLERVIRSIGLVPAPEVPTVAAALYSPGAWASTTLDIRMVAVAARHAPDLDSSHPLAEQLAWRDVLEFMHDRYSDYIAQKADNSQWEESGRGLYNLASMSAGHVETFIRAVSENSGIRVE